MPLSNAIACILAYTTPLHTTAFKMFWANTAIKAISRLRGERNRLRHVNVWKDEDSKKDISVKNFDLFTTIAIHATCWSVFVCNSSSIQWVYALHFIYPNNNKKLLRKKQKCVKDGKKKRLLNLNMTLPQSPRTNDLANHKLAQEPVRRIVINHPSVTI